MCVWTLSSSAAVGQLACCHARTVGAVRLLSSCSARCQCVDDEEEEMSGCLLRRGATRDEERGSCIEGGQQRHARSPPPDAQLTHHRAETDRAARASEPVMD